MIIFVMIVKGQSSGCLSNSEIEFNAQTTNISLTENSSGILDFSINGGTPPYNMDLLVGDTVISAYDIYENNYQYEISSEVLSQIIEAFPNNSIDIVVADSEGCENSFIGDLTSLKQNIIVTPSDCESNTGMIEIISVFEDDIEDNILPECDIIHNDNSSFDINDGRTHCITYSGIINNININNGELVTYGDLEVINLTTSNYSLVNAGELLIHGDLNVNSNSSLINYGEIISYGSINVSGNLNNYGDIIANRLSNNSSGSVISEDSINVDVLLNDGDLLLGGVVYVESAINNSSGKVVLTGAKLLGNSLWNDGDINRVDDCSNVEFLSYNGNVLVDPTIICDGICTCELDGNQEVIWSDGFVGNKRIDLAPGIYSFDIVSLNGTTSHSVQVDRFSSCNEDPVFSVSLEDYLEIYPSPQLENESQTFELSLTQESLVEIKIYNSAGFVVSTPFIGFFDEGVHIYDWSGDVSSNNGVYYCWININGNIETKLFVNMASK